MRKYFFYFASGLLLLSLNACGAASSTKIGPSRYEVRAWPTIGSAGSNFTDQAQENCPKGYKVIERHIEGNNVVGSIECE